MWRKWDNEGQLKAEQGGSSEASVGQTHQLREGYSLSTYIYILRINQKWSQKFLIIKEKNLNNQLYILDKIKKYTFLKSQVIGIFHLQRLLEKNLFQNSMETKIRFYLIKKEVNT